MKKIILSSPLFYPALLILICLFVAFKNYTPGTFLTGWDTLHPEFNFEVNFQKLIFGVWRSDQGLGDMSGHSHMADLPRVIILWLFHFIFPLSFLRYSYIFLCLILGPLGFYFLIKFLFVNHKSSFINQISFLSSLAYLLNLGTVQQFYVPFEMFPTQWAFLPWIILFTLKFLHLPSRRHLIFFSLLTLFATPQAYAAHLWYPFFGLYCLFLFIYALSTRTKSSSPLILLTITLLLNSFWLLPNLYYAATQSLTVKNNKVNRLHSQEFLLKNRETGTIADSSLIKGFYFNWDIYNFTKKTSDKLMPQWNDHVKNLDVLLIGNLLFFLALIGLIAAFKKNNRHLIALSPFFIIPFILLTNRTPVFNLFFNLLLKNSLLQEILRFVFTKFSIFFTFGLCLYLANFLYLLFSISFFNRLKNYFSLIFVFSLLVYCYPIFQGNLISPNIRIEIPSYYFQLWQFLDRKAPAKILTLPLYEPSGWQYYSWGYQGSGFIWFATPHSFFDRDSDRWSTFNEESFREFYYPLYGNNPAQFLSSLQKYNVTYLLWDQSIVPTFPKNRDQITFRYETQRLIDELQTNGSLLLLGQFGPIQLYRTTNPYSLVTVENINQFLGPQYDLSFFDYQFQGRDYLTTNSSKDVSYPFRSILTASDRINPDLVKFTQEDAQIYLNLGSLPQFPVTISTYNPRTTISSLNNTQTYNLDLNSLAHHQSYIIAIQSRYHQGIPLRFCLKNSYSGLCSYEDELNKHSQMNWDYFLIPPMDDFTGYQLQISAISYGHQFTKSDLGQIQIIPLPYSELANFTNQAPLPSHNILEPSIYQSIFPNNSLIKITLNPQSRGTNLYLNLLQSYSPAWLAFYFQKNKVISLDNHYLLNNWANSWQLPVNNLPTTIYIFFWPQLLEFIGFISIPATFFWLIRHQYHQSKPL